MRRRRHTVGWTATAVALVAVVLIVVSHRLQNTDNPSPEDPGKTKANSAISASVKEIEEMHSQQQLGAHPAPEIVEDSAGTEDAWCSDPAKAEQVEQLVREQSTHDVSRVYSVLLRPLALTMSERDALLNLIIDIRIAAAHTPCKPGEVLDEQERSELISAIIGDARLQHLLSLERNLREFHELVYIQAVLQKQEIPMTEAERGRILDILIEIERQDLVAPGADAEYGSVEHFEYLLARINERERLLFEQAASILSVEQIEVLFAQYQMESYRRADAIERQKKARAQGDDDLPLYYPARTIPEDP